LRAGAIVWHSTRVQRRRAVASPPVRIPGSVIAIAGAALAIRLIHLSAMRSIVLEHPPPYGMDRWLSMEIAAAIAGGDWSGGWAAPYDSSPGYSYVLALLYAGTGRQWVGPLLVQLLLGALTPLLVYALARDLRNHAVGLVAALLAACYLPAVFYEGLLVKFALVPFTTALALLGLQRVREGRLGWAHPAGLALGGLGLLRPNMFLVAPVVVAWSARAAGRRAAIRRVAAVAAAALLLLGPMALRDRLAAARGRTAALGGIHFYIGTNPQADGEYVVLDGIRPDIVGHVVDARREAERRVGRTLSGPEVSRFWLERGLAFIRADPGRYALLEVRKLWLALEAHERGSFGDDYAELQPASPVLRLPLITFGVLAPLGFVGLGACIRRRQWLLPLFVLATLVSLLPFFVAGRYRLPLAVPMIVAAALGLDALHELVARRGPRVLLAAVPGLALVAVVLGASDAQVLALVGTLGAGLLVLRWFTEHSGLEVAERT
jgi:4-amino-4-deoxy-L-arabinose transferase-like glycosyltransferase